MPLSFTKKRLSSFVLAFLFFLSGTQAQSKARVTIGEKVRNAQIVATERGGQEFAGVLVYANNAWTKVCFNKDDLQVIYKAAKNYFADFDAMKLKKGKKTTIKKYGTLSCFVEWGSDKNFIDRFADTRADLGYVFVRTAPYFAVTIAAAQNQNDGQKSSAYQKFEKLTLLFTKSQIADLLEKLFE